MEKKYTWYKIAGGQEEIHFQMNNMAVMEVNGKTISLARHQDELFAFAHKCPHAGSILAEGSIDSKGNVVCPMHGYRFNVINGRNVTGEGYTLMHWPVERRENGIFVGMEEGLLSR
ncbi:MAG: Rieske 2Fe-2S domain-containing protein [Chitinophagaceae bacterium]